MLRLLLTGLMALYPLVARCDVQKMETLERLFDRRVARVEEKFELVQLILGTLVPQEVQGLSKQLGIPTELLSVHPEFVGMAASSSINRIMISMPVYEQSPQATLAFTLAHEYAHIELSHQKEAKRFLIGRIAPFCNPCNSDEDLESALEKFGQSGFVESPERIAELQKKEIDADEQALARMFQAGMLAEGMRNPLYDYLNKWTTGISPEWEERIKNVDSAISELMSLQRMLHL